MSIVGMNDLNSVAMWDQSLPPSISSFFPGLEFGFGSSLNTRVDWRETPGAHVWKVMLPGFTNEDVLVELQDERVLQVSVDSANFLTKFRIPDNGNLQQLNANMRHGILVVTVPKFHQPTLSLVQIQSTH